MSVPLSDQPEVCVILPPAEMGTLCLPDEFEPKAGDLVVFRVVLDDDGGFSLMFEPGVNVSEHGLTIVTTDDGEYAVPQPVAGYIAALRRKVMSRPKAALAALIARFEARIAELEAENADLRADRSPGQRMVASAKEALEIVRSGEAEAICRAIAAPVLSSNPTR